MDVMFVQDITGDSVMLRWDARNLILEVAKSDISGEVALGSFVEVTADGGLAVSSATWTREEVLEVERRAAEMKEALGWADG
ncbi:MAG: hypothetical protein AMJ69_12770 [Gammaproteobacteria bacterium SG8_47]|nr:MAG: hypothetical protein AMJ69_12770 [Gammaproteobacteria bacterium SG8_47]